MQNVKVMEYGLLLKKKVCGLGENKFRNILLQSSHLISTEVLR